MDRQEALEMFLNEVKRLNEEEHVDDLRKAKRYEELSRVECRICNALMAYVGQEDDLNLRTEEIPKGSFFAASMLINIIGVSGLLEDDEEFAAQLVQEAGELGKSIAFRVYNDKLTISEIEWAEFFNDSYAKNYDDEYGNE